MSKIRFYLVAGVLMVTAALALVGAHAALASGSVMVNFNGATPGDPCIDSFQGRLSATSDAGTIISNTTWAGDSAPECQGGNYLDIFVNGTPLPTSFAFDFEGPDFFSFTWSPSLSGSGAAYSCSPLSFGHNSCEVPGGFDELSITSISGEVYFDNFRFGFPGGGSSEAAAESTVVPCTDARINCHLYDDQIVLYGADNGAAIDVFIVDGSSEGQYLFTINAADFGSYLTNPPAHDMLIKKVGDVSVYVLTTGEVQVNYGPDASGKTYVIIMSGINGGDPYGYTLP